MERAGAECPLLGSWYPAPTETKMYRAECKAQEALVEEMIKGCVILFKKSATISIEERRQITLRKVSSYVRQYHPNIADILG